jgi:hypothetical protein
MRRLALALLLAAQGSLGCFALDLIDEGQKELERYSGGRKAEQAEAAAPAKTGQPQSPTRADLQRWWNSARTLAPSEAKAKLVRCSIGGRVEFSVEVDCLTRGGRIVAAGG